MPTTVILGAARTPIGKMGGALASVGAPELGATAITAALERASVDPEQVQHVIMGQVLQAGQGQIPSRQAQIQAGIPKEVSSETINKVCASGLRASVLLDQAIRAGDVEIGVGGGMESMSNAPYLLPNARFGFRMGDTKALDAMVHDGLTNPFSGRQMFDEATEIGTELEITRPDLDRWALRSHQLAVKATDEGRLPEEIVAVTVKGRKGDTVVEIDEAPRRDTSLETLAKLPGLVGKEGSHTAGNSPGVNDGGGAIVLSSDEWATANGKEVLAEIVAHAQSANDFAYLATTPATAREEGAREGRPPARRHRPVGDQRGVRLGHDQLDPDARHRRGARERERGRRRAGPPDRSLRRAHHRRARARAAPPGRRLRLRRDLLRRWPGRRADREGVTEARPYAVDPPGGERRTGPPARAAAFFDLDRTLVAGSSSFEFGRAAYRAGMISRRQILSDTVENIRFRLHGSTDDSTERVITRIGEWLAGTRRAELARLSPEALAGILPRVYPKMLELAYEHQDAGRLVYIATAAGSDLAETLAYVLQFDGGIGTRLEVIDGRYTGKLAGPFTYREGKAKAIREIAEAEGIDLAESYAYSDSESDLPMLRMVGHPVVVNPDRELAEVAAAEGWEVIRFETLGRRLKLAGAVTTAVLAGGLGRAVAIRRRG